MEWGGGCGFGFGGKEMMLMGRMNGRGAVGRECRLGSSDQIATEQLIMVHDHRF